MRLLNIVVLGVRGNSRASGVYSMTPALNTRKDCSMIFGRVVVPAESQRSYYARNRKVPAFVDDIVIDP
jgi:hypothetical protein